MDRTRALDAFEAYVSAYDPGNPRIALKIDHTMRVASLCERIAREIGLSDDDVDMAWLVGLLHDIGRFEQVRQYDSYNDAATVNHAAFGAKVLFEDAPCGEMPGKGAPGKGEFVEDAQGEGVLSDEAPGKGTACECLSDDSGVGASSDCRLIRCFIEDASCDDLIRTAVITHSAYRLPTELPERTHTLCEVLRDADKIDILKVNCVSPIEDVYGVPERDMLESDLSPACVDIFYEHRCIPRDVRRYPADVLLGQVCFAWELVFSQSLEIVREQGHLRQMLDRPWNKLATRQAFAEMSLHMRQELGV